MRPITEQTVLVTGATDGLGQALATELAGHGATLLLHGRDDARGKAVLAEISEQTGNDRLHWYRADLAELAQVRALAERVGAETDRLDTLVSNAGVGATVPGGGERQESADGHELRFAVNYLAGFLLTRSLLPRLTASAPARIVHVSSAAQTPIDFDDVMLTRGYSGGRAYAQSKLAQILFSMDLADELDAQVVTSNALHPATFMPTKIVDRPTSDLADGVEATARLVTDAGLDTTSGRYFHGTRETRPDEQAHDPDARARLRELSEQLTGVR